MKYLIKTFIISILCFSYFENSFANDKKYDEVFKKVGKHKKKD